MNLKEKLAQAKAMKAKLADEVRKASMELATELAEPTTLANVEAELQAGPVTTEPLSPLAAMRARMAEAKAKKEDKPEAQKLHEQLVVSQSDLLVLAAENTPAQLIQKAEIATTEDEAAVYNKALDTQEAIGHSPEKPAPEAKLSLKERLALRAAEVAKGEPLPEAPAPAAPKPKPMSLKERLALKKQEAPNKIPAVVVDGPIVRQEPVDSNYNEEGIRANRAAVALNERQLLARTVFVDQGESCVLIGPAGTGKTTGVRGVVRGLMDANKLSYTSNYKKQGGGSKSIRVENQPNIAICAYTKRAAMNIMESITSQEGMEEFRYCCQTIHNLLEYGPEEVQVWDDALGDYKTTMRFIPAKDATNKIECEFLIVEEASMVDLELWAKLLDALPDSCTILLLGDINQLPPVFGLPILVYAMYKLQVIELTEVYRQAIGPVLNNAHRVLKGEMVEEETDDEHSFVCYEEYKADNGKVNIRRHIDSHKGEDMMVGETKLAAIYTQLFKKLFEAGRYDPEEDMIISPFNVGDLGTVHMNLSLAQFIGQAREAVVYEIKAGFNTVYLAPGDKVMVDRQDGWITKIELNPVYQGTLPQPEGKDLTRFGTRIIGMGQGVDIDLDEAADTNFDMEMLDENSAEELMRASSHKVYIQMESGEERILQSKGDFALEKFTLGYCITGHKSQGSEWRNVYIIMNKRHHNLISREWLYTTITRTRKNCTLLCKPYSIKKAIERQTIAGDSMEEKLAWFTSGAVDNIDEVQVLPCGA